MHRLPAALAVLEAGGDLLPAGRRTWPTRSGTCPTSWPPTVQDRVLAKAPDQTVAEIKRAVARAVQAADPASAADRHQQAAAARTIERMPQPDGMESSWLTMPRRRRTTCGTP